MSKDAAKIFANDWYETGDEKSDTQKFWWTLLRDVFDVARPEKIIDFEISVFHRRLHFHDKSFNRAKKTCNFSEFRIYKCGRDEPTIIKLCDLRYQFLRLKFLIDPTADDTPPEEKFLPKLLPSSKKFTMPSRKITSQ